MHRVLNNKLLLFIVAVLLLANIAMLVYFVWMKDPRPKSHRKERQRSPIGVLLEKKVGFSQDQMSRYESLRQQNRQKMKPLFDEIRVAKISFYRLLSRPVVDSAAVNEAAAVIGEKQKSIDLEAFRNFRSFRALATPEQQAKYDSLVPGVIEEMWFTERRESSRGKDDSLQKNHRN